MFVNAKFDQTVKSKNYGNRKSLYAREVEMLHEFSASKHENVELEYSNAKQAVSARAAITKHIKDNKMSLIVCRRQNLLYVIKSEVNRA